MDFLREKPIRTFLEERDTLISRPKLVSMVSQRGVPMVDLPVGVSRSDAVDTIAGTNWARGIAQGIADKGGLSGKSRETFIEKFARTVAEGIVSSSYLPAIASRAPGRPRTTAKSTPVRLGKEITQEELEAATKKS